MEKQNGSHTNPETSRWIKRCPALSVVALVEGEEVIVVFTVTVVVAAVAVVQAVCCKSGRHEVLGVVVTADVTDPRAYANISSSSYANQVPLIQNNKRCCRTQQWRFTPPSPIVVASVEGSKALTQSHRHDTRPISIGKVGWEIPWGQATVAWAVSIYANNLTDWRGEVCNLMGKNDFRYYSFIIELT